MADTTFVAGSTVILASWLNDVNDFVYTNGATKTGVETLTNKTISLGSNTISGTTAQFNTALSDGNFATLAGNETLTNKSLTSPTLTGTTNAATITATGAVTSNGTAGVGYSTGAGGTVTQATSKSTGVTLNKITGAITMNNANITAGSEVSFTVTNSTVDTTDAVIVNHASAGTAGSYGVFAHSIASGSFAITVTNLSGSTLGEAIVIRFTVIKGVSA